MDRFDYSGYVRAPSADEADEDRRENDIARQMKPVEDILGEVRGLIDRMAALTEYHKVDNIGDVERFYENASEWAFAIQQSIRG